MTATIRRMGVLALFMLVTALPGVVSADAEALPPSDGSLLRWTPEQTMLGFRQMERIFPARVIRAGEATLDLSHGAEIDVRFEFDGARFDTDSYMEAHRVTGILVLKGDQIVLERYAHDRDPQHLWASFSVAKSMTSTLVGAAIADGYIESLDARLAEYLPETSGTAYGDVTIRQLLTMTSGIAWNEDYGDPMSDIARVYATPPTDPSINPVISYMRELPRAHPPGTQFNYSTGETDLVGFLLSRAIGRDLAEYLEEKIWRPFGMESDAIWQLDSEGHERGGCCMSVTLRDYGRIGLFMLNGGEINGTRVLPEGWIDEATTNQLPEPLANGGGYGYFWWTLPDGSYRASGIFGQLIHIVPEQNLVIVTNAAWPAPVGSQWGGARQAFVDAVREAVR
jgi:CubicO group peptidase (beta-lactamase class C family)